MCLFLSWRGLGLPLFSSIVIIIIKYIKFIILTGWMCVLFTFFFDKSVIGEGCCDWKTWIYELYLNLIFLSAFKILKFVWEMSIQGRFVSFGDICLPAKGERWSRKQFLRTEIVQVKVLWVVVKEKLRGKNLFRTVFVEYFDGKPLHDLF